MVEVVHTELFFVSFIPHRNAERTYIVTILSFCQ